MALIINIYAEIDVEVRFTGEYPLLYVTGSSQYATIYDIENQFFGRVVEGMDRTELHTIVEKALYRYLVFGKKKDFSVAEQEYIKYVELSEGNFFGLTDNEVISSYLDLSSQDFEEEVTRRAVMREYEKELKKRGY